LQHFVRFSTSFPQTETGIDAHTLLNFLLHREKRRTLQIDVHLEASIERMRGDTGFRLCKYTCTDLPPVLPCCHFAAYYSFPEKKSVPELNDQTTYILKKNKTSTPNQVCPNGVIIIEECTIILEPALQHIVILNASQKHISAVVK